jgi:hypothetical protein
MRIQKDLIAMTVAAALMPAVGLQGIAHCDRQKSEIQEVRTVLHAECVRAMPSKTDAVLRPNETAILHGLATYNKLKRFSPVAHQALATAKIAVAEECSCID